MDPRIKATLDYIEDNLSKPLVLKELAQVACMSKSQFHRLFKSTTKRTPFKFIEELKMTRAYRLIVEEEAMIHDTAFALGYNDYETFSRAFKKHHLLSPDDLKAIAQKVRSQTAESRKDEVIILTVDESVNEADILSKIRKIVDENNWSTKDLQQFKVFKIESIKGEVTSSNGLIKKKYQLTQDHKLWELLLDSTS